jgi:hypothetical protein
LELISILAFRGLFEEGNVEFEWDASKRRQVMEKHGIDILYAAQIFENPVFT